VEKQSFNTEKDEHIRLTKDLQVSSRFYQDTIINPKETHPGSRWC